MAHLLTRDDLRGGEFLDLSRGIPSDAHLQKNHLAPDEFAFKQSITDCPLT